MHHITIEGVSSTANQQEVELAIGALERGDLTLLKGDIGYGLLGSAEQAIKKMYEAKGRSLSNPCIVIGNLDILNDVALIPDAKIGAWIEQTARYTRSRPSCPSTPKAACSAACRRGCIARP